MRKNLIAYRVLLVPAGETLPPLKAFDQRAHSDIESSRLSKLLRRLKSNKVTSLDRRALAQRASNLFAFYNSLAKVLAAFRPPVHKYPSRDRVQRIVPNFRSGEGYDQSSPTDEDALSTPAAATLSYV
jgi:hypothetical protein